MPEKKECIQEEENVFLMHNNYIHQEIATSK